MEIDQDIPITNRDEEGLWLPCCTKMIIPIKITDKYLLYNVGTPMGYKRGDAFLVSLFYPPHQYKIQEIDNEVSTESMVYFKVAWKDDESDDVKDRVRQIHAEILGGIAGSQGDENKENECPPPPQEDEEV